jgi:hypothetical protein
VSASAGVSPLAEPFAPGSPWAGAARALLEAAIRRHGGWDAWRALESIVVRPRRLTGFLPRLKGVGRTFSLPPRAELRPHEGRATFHDYPTPGRRGIFARGEVALFDEHGGEVLRRPNARASFRGFAKHRRWSPADALYFFGYALTHYHALPFTLVEGVPLRTIRARFEGRRLTGVEVELPASLHTHCRRQTFYFEEDGLLRRHDYFAEIVATVARGAHFWRDFEVVHGLELARTRRVVARLGRWPLPFPVLEADLAFSDEG